MIKFRTLAIFIAFLISYSSKCQTGEFSTQYILEEAELLYSLIKATDESSRKFESDSTLSYKLPNGGIKSITWNREYQVNKSIDYDPFLMIKGENNDITESTSDEKLLIDSFYEIQKILESGELDLEGRNTTLIPAFTFDHQLRNPDIEHSDTQLVVYLIRDDQDESIVAMGSDFYIEFSSLGFVNDIYVIDQDYFDHPASKIIESEQVQGVVHGHSGTDDPIISPTEICSILLHKDIIRWKELTITRSYTDSTFTEATYNVQDHTLSIVEKPNKEFNNNIPRWAVLVRLGDLSFMEYFDSLDEMSKAIFDKIDDSLFKSRIIYKPEQAFAQYPDLSVGRLGLVELIIKKSKSKYLSEEIAGKLK